MAKDLSVGDKVTWNTTKGSIKGTIEKKITAEIKVKGHIAKPTKSDPQYLVKSEKTGGRAAHKPNALKKM